LQARWPIAAAGATVALVVVLATSASAQPRRGSDDYGGGRATAYRVKLGGNGTGRQRGRIGNPRDRDDFKFVSPIGGWLLIRVDVPAHGSLHPRLSAFGAGKARIVKRVPCCGRSDSKLVLRVERGLTYYVQVTGDHGTVGPYVLDIGRSGPLGRQPNLVLILTDDQSFESVAKMPYVSSLKSWDTFDHAYINNATCCPSRATILTGLWSHHHGVEESNAAPRFDDRSTLATWLHAAGYRTELVGKYHLGTVDETASDTYIPPGWDGWYAWHGMSSRQAYYDYTLNENGKLVSYGSAPDDYSTDVLAKEAVRFIDANADQTPFFLYFAPRGPHNPWTAAPRDLHAFADLPVPHSPNYDEADMSDKPAWWRALTVRKSENTDGAVRKEYATLLSIDDAVKAIVAALRSKQLMDDTVIVFMTDNGYSFGSHRYVGKVCAYEECNHTPFLVWYPGAGGRKVDDIVSNADIAPTFAELAGIDPGAPVDGRSFVPLLLGPAPPDWPEEVLLRGVHHVDAEGTRIPTFWGLRTLQYKYIETVDTGEVELYDLARDPYELRNVADDPGYATIRDDLAQRLRRMRSAPPHRPDG